MLSSRINWGMQSNTISARIDAARGSGMPLLDLTISNPTTVGLRYPEEAILDALSERRALLYDPAPQGLVEARESISAYYAARQRKISPGDILLTASTSEAYAFAFKLLTDPGDEILVPAPSYPLFEFLAALENVRTAQYSLIYDRGWFIDFGSLESSIHARTRAIVVVNPNNPTGSFLKQQEWARLRALCLERNLAILSDEVFADYALGDDPSRVPSLAAESGPLTIVMSGLSKVAGLPQVKLGWMIVGGEPSLSARAMTGLSLIADTYLSVGTPVQHAVSRLLTLGADIRDQIRGRIQRNLTCLRSRRAPFTVLDVEGGWYAILQVPRTRTEEEWVLLLLDRDHVLTHPGFFYDFHSEAYLIVSLLTEPAGFDDGISRIAMCVGQ